MDARSGVFYKLAEDKAGIYGGSAVMADKAGGRELSATSEILEQDWAGIRAPLVTCVDITVRGAGGGRVYRVQASLTVPISSKTLRSHEPSSGWPAPSELLTRIPSATGVSPARLRSRAIIMLGHLGGQSRGRPLLPLPAARNAS